MFVLDDAACEAESLRSQLHHSWLKNEVLVLRPEYVARMRGAQSPQRASFEDKIRPGGIFVERIEDARRLCQIMIDGFSPTQLVDASVLLALPEDVRALMKRVLHGAYLQETKIEELGEPLQIAIDDLADELEELRKIWFRESPAEEPVITAAVQRVVQCAGKLREILTRLPTGIVLP